MMRPMKLAGSQLLFGKGCLEHIKSLDYKRIAVVLGGSSMVKSGMLNKVRGMFQENGAEVTVIEGVEPDPSFATVKRGAQQMLDFQPDLIVALGGGSVMDAAKTMWLYYEHPELETLEDVLVASPFPKLREKAYFCCIPSTAGTASEVSRSVVISDTETGMKHGIGNMEMMPDIAICDPEVTLSMPAHITAETGMDALTHAIEGYTTKGAWEMTDMFNLKAIEVIARSLRDAVENKPEGREGMALGQYLTGMGFSNCGLGIVHSMAHGLGALYDTPHGVANAIILPTVMEYNAPCTGTKFKDIAIAMGVDGVENMTQEEYRKAAVDAVKKLSADVGIPADLKEILKPEDVDFLSQSAMDDACRPGNPKDPSFEDIKNLYLSLM